MPKTRLDVRMVEVGIAETRSKAQALVLAGQVQVNGRRETKAGALVQISDVLTIDGPKLPYVSRGGLKLSHALDFFRVDPSGWDVVDVGASTGGFTDCWLQRGAHAVYAVDVGYGQLDWRLRSDERVTVRERLNARWLTLQQLNRQDPLDAASIDASFIGIALLLAPLYAMLSSSGMVIGLIKPQFEAGPAHVGKHGVVRDPRVHREVLETVLDKAETLGYRIAGLTASPIRGPEGNIEFLGFWTLHGDSTNIDVNRVIDEAWQEASE